jgi:hypothetical protein
MTESLIVTIVTVVVLVLVLLTFVYFYFRAIREDVMNYWLLLVDKLRVRLDKIPNLIETVRRHVEGKEDLLLELAKARTETWPIAELEVTGILHQAWGIAKEHEVLAKNTNFLSLKMEFKEINKEIEDMGEIYNHKIRKFNGKVGFILWRPMLRLMGFKKLPIFEFEG